MGLILTSNFFLFTSINILDHVQNPYSTLICCLGVVIKTHPAMIFVLLKLSYCLIVLLSVNDNTDRGLGLINSGHRTPLCAKADTEAPSANTVDRALGTGQCWVLSVGH